MQPVDPIVGGQALRIPSIHSPDFVHLVSGWTINKDGSAEFNNLTVRGTFMGTDFEINSAGAFFYDGTPTANNLTFSIASHAGTDEFGNVYLAGFVAYDTAGDTQLVQYIQMIQGTIFIGEVVGGVLPLLPAEIGANGDHIFHATPVDPNNPTTTNDQLFFDIKGGATGQASGSSTTPRVQLSDSADSSAADLWMSGSVVYTDDSGTPQTKQVPTPGTGWTLSAAALRGAPPCRFWREGDTVQVRGAMATTSATPAGVAFAVGAAYRPVAAWDLQQDYLFQQSSAGVQKGPAHVFISAANLSVNGLTAAAVGDVVNFNFSYTLGHVP